MALGPVRFDPFDGVGESSATRAADSARGDRAIPWNTRIRSAMRALVSPTADQLAPRHGSTTNYVSGLSHELRQPLTVLDLTLQQFAMCCPPLDDEASQLLADIQADVRGLFAVADDVLMLSRMDSIDAQHHCNAYAIASDVIEGLSTLEAASGIRLAVTGDTDADASIPPTSLRRCVTALVDNAMKHSPRESTVVVDVARTNREVLVLVTDCGDGVDSAALGRVFERNVCVDESRSGRPGFGIGLALVHDTAARYHGAAWIVETGPQGTTIGLRLPAAGERG